MLLALLMLVSTVLPAFPAEAAPAYTAGTYKLTGNMYVRTGPDKSYSSIGAATKGTTIALNTNYLFDYK